MYKNLILRKHYVIISYSTLPTSYEDLSSDTSSTHIATYKTHMYIRTYIRLSTSTVLLRVLASLAFPLACPGHVWKFWIIQGHSVQIHTDSGILGTIDWNYGRIV